MTSTNRPRGGEGLLGTPPVRAPAFPTTLDWLNTGGRSLALDALRGRIVLLDFWTYG